MNVYTKCKYITNSHSVCGCNSQMSQYSIKLRKVKEILRNYFFYLYFSKL